MRHLIIAAFLLICTSDLRAQWYSGYYSAESGLDIPMPSAPVSAEDASSFKASRSLIGSNVEWARYQGTPIQGCMTPSERMAACGPIAAEALVRALANDPHLNKICDIWHIAKSKGYWSGAMQGPDWAGERGLLRDLNIQAELTWISNINSGENMIVESLQRGKPVIISTRRHYFFAQGYNPSNHQFFVGHTGRIMGNYGGRDHMTLSEISRAGNGSLALLIVP